MGHSRHGVAELRGRCTILSTPVCQRVERERGVVWIEPSVTYNELMRGRQRDAVVLESVTNSPYLPHYWHLCAPLAVTARVLTHRPTLAGSPRSYKWNTRTAAMSRIRTRITPAPRMSESRGMLIMPVHLRRRRTPPAEDWHIEVQDRKAKRWERFTGNSW
jgi:hypothetical protein